MTTIGIRSLAVSLPKTVRTNDYFRARHPELVADAERRALGRLFARTPDAEGEANAWDREMSAYLGDPFRGTVERRVLANGERALDMEASAGQAALDAAGMAAGDVELAIVGSFLPDQLGVGNAAFLVERMGLRCAAWNIETACTTGLVALQTATSLVASGQYRNVLVVASCSYSRFLDERDTLGWFMGDAAGAFVVGPVPAGQGCLGFKTVHTAATCGTFYYDLFDDPDVGPRVRIQCRPETGRIIRDTSEGYVRACAEGAARAAGVELRDIDFFVFNSPTAWFAAFAARVLGIDPARTLTTYPRYGNIGPALMPVNLYEAAATGRIASGSLVMVYTIGSVSSAGAVVMRWGDVGLGAREAAPT